METKTNMGSQADMEEEGDVEEEDPIQSKEADDILESENREDGKDLKTSATSTNIGQNAMVPHGHTGHCDCGSQLYRSDSKHRQSAGPGTWVYEPSTKRLRKLDTLLQRVSGQRLFIRHHNSTVDEPGFRRHCDQWVGRDNIRGRELGGGIRINNKHHGSEPGQEHKVEEVDHSGGTTTNGGGRTEPTLQGIRVDEEPSQNGTTDSELAERLLGSDRSSTIDRHSDDNVGSITTTRIGGIGSNRNQPLTRSPVRGQAGILRGARERGPSPLKKTRFPELVPQPPKKKMRVI